MFGAKRDYCRCCGRLFCDSCADTSCTLPDLGSSNIIASFLFDVCLDSLPKCACVAPVLHTVPTEALGQDQGAAVQGSLQACLVSRNTSPQLVQAETPTWAIPTFYLQETATIDSRLNFRSPSSHIFQLIQNLIFADI